MKVDSFIRADIANIVISYFGAYGKNGVTFSPCCMSVACTLQQLKDVTCHVFSELSNYTRF